MKRAVREPKPQQNPPREIVPRQKKSHKLTMDTIDRYWAQVVDHDYYLRGAAEIALRRIER